MPVRPSTAGEPPRALVTGHYHSLSPVTFSGAPRVVEHFQRLLTDAVSVLRTSSVLQLLTVPSRELSSTADDGRAAPIVAVLELLAKTAAETPLESIQPCNDVRRPWSAPVGSGRPSRKGDAKGGAPRKGNGEARDASSGQQQHPLPPRAANPAQPSSRPTSGSSTKSSSSRPGSGKKVSFNASEDAPSREAKPQRVGGLPASDRATGGGGSGGDAQHRLDTPMSKVIECLHELKMRSLDDETVDIIDTALEQLADANELYNPDFEGKAGPGGTVAAGDVETREWLAANYMESPRFQSKKPKRTLRSISKTIVNSMWMMKAARGLSSGAAIDDVPTPPGLGLEGRDALRLQALLARVNEWDFDVFAVAELTGRPLEVVGYALFRTSGVMEKCDVRDGCLVKFLREAERRYNANPYHNSTHAADVLQTLCYFLRKGELSTHMTPLETLAAMTAAVAHDLLHDGVNNNFHVEVTSDVAIAHNNKSVLESLSSVTFFQMIRDDPEMDILSGLEPDARKEVRGIVIDAILATDMSAHFALVGQLKSKIAASGSHDVERQDVMLLIKLALKCADVSNPAKGRAIYIRWAELVMEEFFAQGDREKALGLKVSPFMDRETTSIPKCQVGFIEFIVRPLYQACSAFLEEMDEPLRVLDSNLQYYKGLLEKETVG